MDRSKLAVYFGEQQAAAYDERWAKLAPMRDALHIFMRGVLAELPADARFLCVGVGTGAELVALAHDFPGWAFTAVEPSAPMMAICRKKAAENGLAERCTFHEGYLDSLPLTGRFDGATALLVSQFIMDKERRIDFFREIAKRLEPGALLVNADLASSVRGAAFDSLVEVWLKVHGGSSQGAGKPPCSAWGKDVAVLPTGEVESIMAAGGFGMPVLFYQALFIHAWHARVEAEAGEHDAGARLLSPRRGGRLPT